MTHDACGSSIGDVAWRWPADDPAGRLPTFAASPVRSNGSASTPTTTSRCRRSIPASSIPSNHPGPDDDIEAVIVAAQASTLDRVYRQHVAARENLRLQLGDQVIYGGGVIRRRGIGQILLVS